VAPEPEEPSVTPEPYWVLWRVWPRATPNKLHSW